MRRTITLWVLAVSLSALACWAWAADQTILGRSFIVKNPGGPEKRKVTGVGKEENSPETIVGDPTVGGATLTVIANGTSPSSQVFALPQGNSSSGKEFWRTTDLGFKYKDGNGDQGPVKSVTIRKTAGGIFTIKAVADGKNGTLNVVPPNPGTDGFVILKVGGGDRYCVQFGGDGKVENKDGTLFKVRVHRPVSEGCPGGTTSSTTTSTTTTSTTTTTT